MDDTTGGESFADALIKVKNGGKVARQGWNGVDMFVFLVTGSVLHTDIPISGRASGGTETPVEAYLAIWAGERGVFPWTPSQADLLANDWYEVANE